MVRVTYPGGFHWLWVGSSHWPCKMKLVCQTQQACLQPTGANRNGLIGLAEGMGWRRESSEFTRSARSHPVSRHDSSHFSSILCDLPSRWLLSCLRSSFNHEFLPVDQVLEGSWVYSYQSWYCWATDGFKMKGTCRVTIDNNSPSAFLEPFSTNHS